jgi:hypothetical protein
MHPYLIARVNPFVAEVNGVRAPDEFGYPTGTAVIRVSSQLSCDATGYGSKLYLPFSNPCVLTPGSVAGGTITWAGGTNQTAPQNAALINIATAYRTVAWGVRITADSSLTNSQGHVWVAHVPATTITHLYNHAPTTEAQVAALPECEKFSVTNLAQKPIVVAGRPIDDGIYRFRSTSLLAPGADVVESMTGWCNIIVYTSGGLQTTSLNVELIMHIEYVQDGDSLYGFIDTLPGRYEPQVMVRASETDAAMPVGILDSIANTADSIASFSSRIVQAGRRLSPLIAGGMRAAGAMRRSVGYLHAPANIPALSWDDEKF